MIRRSILLSRLLFLAGAPALCSAAAATASDAPRVWSAPPAHASTPVKALSIEAPALKNTPAEALFLELPPPDAALKEQVRAQNRKGVAGNRALALGAARALPETSSWNLPQLPWRLEGDRRIARLDVRSPEAAAVRLALLWKGEIGDVVLRFAANGRVVETVSAARLAAAAGRRQELWSPVLDGDTATLEIEAPANVLPQAAVILTRVSHLFADSRALHDAALRRAADIGAAGACETDLACNSSAALDDAANAVGKLVFTKENGGTYACTGVLLNNTGAAPQPLLFSARHCLETAAEAESLNVYWFFRAATCGGGTAPAMQLQTGGAQLLASSADWDWALFRLHQAPPAGVTYAAWTTRAISNGESTVGLHHARGDLLKRSDGYAKRYYDSLAIGSSFIEAYWRSGATEIGSSGSPLFTPHPHAPYYEVRGGLMFGYSSCAAPHTQDYYSRLDRMLPFTREYLAPTEPAPKNRVPVVEFYHRELNHYFMTADPVEIDMLDTGGHAGWERTGLRFFAHDAPVAGAQPVCRYYMRPEAGDSHFYSASARECAEVGERFSSHWIFESGSVFYIPLPNTATGACPAGTQPVWRFFHEAETNHRYTAEVSVRDTLRSTAGWIAEGYGPDAVIMCAQEPGDR